MMRRFYCLSAALIVSFLYGVAQPANKRSFSAEDITTLRTLSDAQVSPDRQGAVFVVTAADTEKNLFTSDLWVVRTDGSQLQRLTYHPASDTHPRWAPDGKSIAFLSDRGDGTQVYQLSLAGGEARQLTKWKTPVGSFEWFPDGRSLLLVAPAPDSPEVESRKKKQDDAFLLGDQFARSQLWIFDLQTADSRALTPSGFHASGSAVEPGGKKIAFVVTPSPEADSSYDAVARWVDVAGATVSGLAESSRAGDLAWSPQGEKLASIRPFDGKGISRADLFTYSTAGGSPKNLSASLDLEVDHFRWTPSGSGIVFEVKRGVHSVLYSVDVASGGMQPLQERKGIVKDFDLAGQDTVVFVGTSADEPDELWIAEGQTTPRRLTHFNEPAASLSLATVEVIRWKNGNDWEIEGLLYKPSSSAARPPYALLVDPHGGPRGHRTYSFDPTAHYFASAGYAVFQPNFRGSTGYGDRFVKGNVADWGPGPFSDVMTGINALAARGLADEGNLFMYGWSYGGIMTNWTITHSNRFRAAASGAGVADGVLQYVISDSRRWRFDYFGGSPFPENLELYRRQSAITYIQQARTPTLFIHGERDVRCPIQHGWMMHRALRDLGVETEMVVYPREGHGFRELRHIVDRAARVRAWFDRHR